MTSPIVARLLEKKEAGACLRSFEEDFAPSSEILWEQAKNLAEKKFGDWPIIDAMDWAQLWFESKGGYWSTYISEEVLEEASKSGDSSLHDWFTKSKSSDGKPGWVQLGGKYAGKPCARQPGQTTKPKCGSSKMKRNLNKDEEEAAFRRKNRQDPNPDRRGKAKNVATEEVVLEGEKDACYHKVKARYKVWPSAYASGALVKCRKVGAKNWGNKTKKESYEMFDEGLKKRLAAAGAAATLAAAGGGAGAKAATHHSGSVNFSSKPVAAKATDKSVKSAVSKAIANPGTSHSASSEKGRRENKVGVSYSMTHTPSKSEKTEKKKDKDKSEKKRSGKHGDPGKPNKPGKPSAKTPSGPRVRGNSGGGSRDRAPEVRSTTSRTGGSTLTKGNRSSSTGGKTLFKFEYEPEGDVVQERVGGAGTLVRQGVKYGGKKGGRAVQKGTTAATKAGKKMAADAKKGSEGAGKGEVRGAAIGGTLGALGGTLIPDGPAMVAGEIAGGYLGSKVGGAIGKKFDKKKPVKEDLTQIDELVNPKINLPFSGDRITHNHGGGGAGAVLGGAAAAGLGAAAMALANRKKKKEEEEEKKKQSKTTNESITAASLGTAAALGAVGGLASGVAGAVGNKAATDAMKKKKKEEEEKKKNLPEACWKGYEKKGMKTMFGKRYPNCVKKKATKEEVEMKTEAYYGGEEQRKKDEKKAAYEKQLKKMLPKRAFDSTGAELDPRSGKRLKEELLPSRNGLMYQILFIWRGKLMNMKLFFPSIRKLDRKQIETSIQKFYPGAMVQRYDLSRFNPSQAYLTAPVHEETIQEKKDHEYSMARSELKTIKNAASRLEKKMGKKGEGELKAWVQSKITKAADYIDTAADYVTNEETIQEKKDLCNHTPKGEVCDVHGDKDCSVKEENIEEGKGMEGMTLKGGHKRPTDQGAGLTQKGVEKYRRQNPGSKLQTAVTTPPSKLKPGSKAAKRRKSFCARSRGWTGERGKAARRRWNC